MKDKQLRRESDSWDHPNEQKMGRDHEEKYAPMDEYSLYQEESSEESKDARIHQDLSSKLDSDISVSVTFGHVTLRGDVESMDEKRQAERIAASQEGVEEVFNLLEVKPFQMGHKSPDTSDENLTKGLY